MTLRAVLLATAMMTSAAAYAQEPTPATSAPAPAAQASVQAAAPAAPAPPATLSASTEPAAPATGAPAAAATAEAAPAPVTGGVVEIAAGAAVLDAKGGAVGKIESVKGDLAVLDTGTVKASIPVSSLAKSDKGVLIGMTKTELEAAARAAATKGS